jgi:glucose/arabinose dehydrogenase
VATIERVRAVTLALVLVLIASACGPGHAAPPDPVGSETSPEALLAAFEALPPPTDRAPFLAPTGSLVASGDLSVPRGFTVERLLPEDSLRHPTALAFAPDGRLAVASDTGFVTSFDVSGPALHDERRIGDGFQLPLGLLYVGNALYVSDNGTVWRVAEATRAPIVRGIPTGEHSTDSLALGPDGMIYLGVGSRFNAAREDDPRSATIVRFAPDGSAFEVFARGLRNPYGLAFHPADGSLWATDNGRDDLGTDVPDELDLVQQGKHYGYPDCYGRSRGSNCDGTVAPLLELEANSSSDGIAFYTGSSFPAEYRQNAFVAQWGSFRRTRGRKIVRVVAVKREGRYEARSVDFATGLDAPLALAVGPSDGGLYVADYGRGTIYRIRWTGGG